MSNWLGFSLSPHFASFSVMPLLSDGPLCVADPFRQQSNCAQDWIYKNTMDEGRTSEDNPKLEDFLGCYSNSPANETQVHCQQEVHHTNQNHTDRINVNIAPSFNTNRNIETGKYSLTSHSSLIQSYHFNDNSRTLIPSDSLQHYDPNSSHSSNDNQETEMYHVPFDSASSFSGFKTWLRQTTPFSSSGESPNEANNCNFQSVSLTVSPSSQNGSVAPFQVVDNSKRAIAKSLTKEPVSRKSMETFGQRTSRYRGVTRHRWTGRYEAH